MNRKFAVIGLGFTALVSTVAMAAPGYGGGADYGGLYLGASAGEILYNEQGLPQMTPTIGIFRIGQQFNPYLAIEGRLGTSVNGGSAYGYHIDAQAIYAGYVKGMLPLSPWISAYAIAGLGGVQWHRNYPDFSSNDVGLSYGIGTEFTLGGNASLDIEWAQLTHGSNAGYSYTANQVTFGVNWHL